MVVNKDSRDNEGIKLNKKDVMKSQPYNPDDCTIWYNNPELREKVEKIKSKFGEPFLITKTGEMLYEDCVVIPAFREGPNGQN